MPSRHKAASAAKSRERAKPAAQPAVKSRLTLNDIASAIGVSRTTVSNAFNQPGQLSGSLRERILGTAHELGYFGPDPAARAMRRTGVHEVGVVFHHDLRYALSDPPSIEFLRGVSKELDARQLNLQLIPKMGQRIRLGAAFQTTADALIVHAEIDPDLAPQVAAAHKPLVLVDSFVLGTTTVSTQDRQGAAMAMAYALVKGPDRVLVLGFPLNEVARRSVMARIRPPRSSYVAGERMAGYLAAARKAGFPLDRISWLEIDDRIPESAAGAVAPLRRQLPRGTRLAVVAMSDRVAIAAQREVSAWKEIKVVAIVGFDDGPAAEQAALTTIRQNAHLKGELAVQALLDGLKPDPLPVELIVRNT